MTKGKNGSLMDIIAKKQLREHASPASIQKSSVKQNRTTGIDILDRTLGGGLPSGSLAYVCADATSMAETFLYQFTQARRSYYFSTERRPIYVLKDIQNLGFKTDDITLVDIYSEYYLNPNGEIADNIGNEHVDAKIAEFTEYNLKKILAEEEQDINIIFDTFSFYLNLNVNHGVIKRLINLIYESTKTLGCLSFLYCLSCTHDKILENEILNLSDVIFNIELEKKLDKISNKLSIPKIRGCAQTAEIIRFKVGNGIHIDTTKDIA